MPMLYVHAETLAFFFWDEHTKSENGLPVNQTAVCDYKQTGEVKESV